MSKLNNKKKGFTLIELLVVISIIGLLSSVVLASLSSGRDKAKEAAKKMAVHQVKNALQLYAVDNGGFPLVTNSLLAGSYISTIDPGIVYSPINEDGSECLLEPCASYSISVGGGDLSESEGGVCGGTLTHDGAYNICTFTSSGTFTVMGNSLSAEVLVVAGGGGGGTASRTGGGGGAGGLYYDALYTIAPGNHAIIIGQGGASNTNGGNTKFGNIEMTGGGKGGGAPNGLEVGSTGGSSGGSQHGTTSWAGGISGQGNSGRGGYDSKNIMLPFAAGGGGGSGSSGSAGTSSGAGNGGSGKTYAISGVSVTYAAGGGGGGENVVAGSGGSGIGGGGGFGPRNATGRPGYDAIGYGSGGGGGGGGGSTGEPFGTTPGGSGSSGIVIIKYLAD